MAAGIRKNRKTATETVSAEQNRLCIRCRRNCKQPATSIIATCPRYYAIRTKQVQIKEWVQQDLFASE